MLKRRCDYGGGSKGEQGAFVMLDALIAILIFSVGILGMMEMQASATASAGAAKYRTDAAMLADRLIAQMWTGDVVNNSALFKTGGATYNIWAASLDCGSTTALTTTCLPNSGGANKPSVVFDTATIGTVNTPAVTITITWQAPSDLTSHSYVTVTQFAP